MARLPQSLDLRAPAGPSQSLETVRPTDYGLGDAAQSLEDYAKARARRDAERDDQQAESILRSEQAAYESEFAGRAAGYDGRDAGFASNELTAFGARFQSLAERDDLSKGVRQALVTRLDRYKTDLGARAIGVEAQKRGGVVAEQVRAKREAQVGEGLVAFNGRFAPAYQELADGFDGSQSDHAGDVLRLFDKSAQETIEAADEALRPELQQRLTARRVQIHAQALEAQDKGHDAYVLGAAKRQASSLVNSVITNPAAYDAALGDIDSVAASLPAALRRDYARDLRGDMAAARVEGLILRDDLDQARAELGDGRYNEVIDPTRLQGLTARLAAAEQSGPKTVEDWTRQLQADAALDAEVDARARGETTGFSLQSIVDTFSPRDQAAARLRLRRADEVFAATGNLDAQSNDELRARAMAPGPDPSDPDYPDKLEAWRLGRKAAAEALDAREKDPAAWAMTSERTGDAADQLQQRWKAFTEADPGAASGRAGAAYAALMIGLQQRAGVPAASRRIFSRDMAGGLVQGYLRAKPAERADALLALGLTVSSLPANVRTAEGEVSAREMALRELRAGGLGTADISAIADLADEPGRLALYADAASNPDATRKLPDPGADVKLAGEVDQRLAAYLATSNTLPGHAPFNAGRRDRAMIVARHLMRTKGLDAGSAAREATADLVDNYRFVDDWRMPAAKAKGVTDGGENWQRARAGVRAATQDVLAKAGEILFAPPDGNPDLTEDQRRTKLAQKVETRGRWVTREDDRGLRLMVEDARGWTPVADRYGRPISLTWDQLIARGSPRGAALSWLAPKVSAARVDPNKAADAFARSIERQETGGTRDPVAAVSPAGALGVMQLMPGTAERAARRLGVPYSQNRLTTDAAYNRQLGREEIRYLSDRYDGNIALVAAAYNAGPGAVDGWLKRFGDPRKGQVSVDAWAAQIPYKETRKYVRAVLPRAFTYLERAG